MFIYTDLATQTRLLPLSFASVSYPYIFAKDHPLLQKNH